MTTNRALYLAGGASALAVCILSGCALFVEEKEDVEDVDCADPGEQSCYGKCCGHGFHCSDFFEGCLRGCMTNENCKEGYVCDSRDCVPASDIPDHCDNEMCDGVCCEFGSYCDERSCKVGCSTHSNCPITYYCDDSLLQCMDTSVACGGWGYSLCENLQTRRANCCGPGSYCPGSMGICEVGCSSALDCKRSQACVNMVCM